jgi:hypothetical protein
MVRKGGDEISFDDHVDQETIFINYVNRRVGDSLNMRFRKEVMEKQPF